MVLPAAFIPAAERYGLMAAIDRWVIRNAFLEYENGIGRADAMLAINLSANSPSDEGFVDLIEGQFTDHRFPAQRACFAINEMSHALGIETVAECVASQAVVDRLCEVGVDYAQGYFFGRAAPWSDTY